MFSGLVIFVLFSAGFVSGLFSLGCQCILRFRFACKVFILKFGVWSPRKGQNDGLKPTLQGKSGPETSK